MHGGKGPNAKTDQEILLLETTSYPDGTVPYSNEETKNHIKVKIGINQATKAINATLLGMRKGEIKKIIPSPNLVKRISFPSNVQPDSTLIIKLILQKILI